MVFLCHPIVKRLKFRDTSLSLASTICILRMQHFANVYSRHFEFSYFLKLFKMFLAQVVKDLVGALQLKIFSYFWELYILLKCLFLSFFSHNWH